MRPRKTRKKRATKKFFKKVAKSFTVFLASLRKR